MIKPPFPYFGGKSRAASLIWSGLGNPVNFIDPFAGSLAVILNRDDYDPSFHTETVNDLDCFLSNFWRATRDDPESVAYWADSPVNEADQQARHLWLLNQAEFREKMKSEPDYYDAKIAGWWVWGLSSWIGSGWCMSPCNQVPHLGSAGQGIHRKNGHSSELHEQEILEYFERLSARLRRVRVCCGDWRRVLTPSVTTNHGITGILLDPPYDHALRDKTLYSSESNISGEVREWAIENGHNPKLRIALCGYSDEHSIPDSWQCKDWHSVRGRARTDNTNHDKERIWFSPNCLKIIEKPIQLSLLGQ
jgi:DNA adenine methylase